VKRRGKLHSFDAVIKFFIQQYQLSTKKDIDKLLKRIDQLEKKIFNRIGTDRTIGTKREASKTEPAETRTTAAQEVFDIIEKYPDGIGIKALKEETGYNDKKVRNVIFRLSKQGRIERKGRGIYIIKH